MVGGSFPERMRAASGLGTSGCSDPFENELFPERKSRFVLDGLSRTAGMSFHERNAIGKERVHRLELLFHVVAIGLPASPAHEQLSIDDERRSAGRSEDAHLFALGVRPPTKLRVGNVSFVAVHVETELPS